MLEIRNLQAFIMEIPWFWNPNQTVRLDQENCKPTIFEVYLTWRTVPCKKSNDPYEPQSDHPVLWTMTGSSGSHRSSFSSLKWHRSGLLLSFLFFLYGYEVVLARITLSNKTQTLTSLFHALSSLPHSHSHLCLSPSLMSATTSSA